MGANSTKASERDEKKKMGSRSKESLAIRWVDETSGSHFVLIRIAAVRQPPCWQRHSRPRPLYFFFLLSPARPLLLPFGTQIVLVIHVDVETGEKGKTGPSRPVPLVNVNLDFRPRGKPETARSERFAKSTKN